MPTLKSRKPQEAKENVSNVEEGWALKETKKPYRCYEAQKTSTRPYHRR